ncbi:hypothetical protein RYX36_002484 [Vicia faba]
MDSHQSKEQSYSKGKDKGLIKKLETVLPRDDTIPQNTATSGSVHSHAKLFRSTRSGRRKKPSAALFVVTTSSKQSQRTTTPCQRSQTSDDDASNRVCYTSAPPPRNRRR